MTSTEKNTPPATRRTAKTLPNAMGDPDTWNAVLPQLRRGVELVKAEHRDKERDEYLAPVMLMVDRFVRQAADYADPPAPLD